MSGIARNQQARTLEEEEKQLEAEIKELLIRIFTKAANKAWIEGNMADFNMWNDYLRQVRELYDEPSK